MKEDLSKRNEPVWPSSGTNEPNTRRTLSFKAVVVMTTNTGIEPTLKDVNTALEKRGYAFSMPADVSAPVVISLNDQ